MRGDAVIPSERRESTICTSMRSGAARHWCAAPLCIVPEDYIFFFVVSAFFAVSITE